MAVDVRRAGQAFGAFLALSFGVLGLGVLGSALPETANADWTTQVSSRLMMGGGVYLPEAPVLDPFPIFELGLRTDLLFGEDSAEQFRIGPALDLRTEDFRTFELAGAAALLLPIDLGFAATLTAGGGYAFRPDNRSGALLLAQLAVGYRSFNYHGVYGYGLNIYFGGRMQPEEPRVWEFTLGFEVDTELVFAIPFMFFAELMGSHDPDEPLQ